MDDEFEGLDDFMMSWTAKFHANRIYDNYIFSSDIEVRAELLFYDEEEYPEDFDKIITKMNYWIDEVVDDSVIFSKDNVWAYKSFINKTSNNIVLCHEEPSDDMLAILMKAKLNTLSGDAFEVGLVEVKSNNNDGINFTFSGNSHGHLPEMKEWIGKHTYFSVPWWYRNDASTMDLIPRRNADLSKKPEFAYDLDFVGDSHDKEPRTLAKVIKHDFRPRVIKGGKSE